MRIPVRRLLAAAVLAVAIVFPGHAVAGERRPVTARGLWAMQRLGTPTLSPDGRAVAFTVQEWSVEKNKSTASVWLVDAAGGTPRRLTTAEANDSAPAWSPDGRRIAFVSKRGDDETTALYVIPVDGGEAREVLEMPFAITAPKWLPDGRHIVVGTTVIPALAGDLSRTNLAAMKKEVKRRKNSKMTARTTEDRQYRYWDKPLYDWQASRLLRVDAENGTIRDLTPGQDRWFQPDGGASFEVSPDGAHVVLAMNSTPPPYRDYLNTDLYLVPTDGSGTRRNLTPYNPGEDSRPAFSPDGRSIFYLRTETPYYSGESSRLWRLDLATGAHTPLTEPIDHSFSQVRLTPDGRMLWLLAEDRGSVPVFRLNPDGTGLEAVHSGGTASALDAGPGVVVFLHSTATHPDELFALDPASGEVRQLTRFNEERMAALEFGRSEEFWFEGAAGDRVQGWLTYPPGFDSAKPYPLVHVLHGGPHTMAGDGWHYRWNAQAIAAPGYVVAQVNRHGSTGFGEAFARSIVGTWGDMPFEDIMKSTDFLLQKVPNLDNRRLAATGASYGGYLATWILGHTDRFACIINHAGASSAYGQFGSDLPFAFDKALGGAPWAGVEGMERNNPMRYADRFRTPTLVIHGELDYRVPYGQALEVYAALQARAVPSRLVLFPDENHWVLTPQNSIHWYWEYHDWLARHLSLPRSPRPEFEPPPE